MDSFLITGGAGFIGSHSAECLARAFPKAHFKILDKMTYAANYENLVHVLDPPLRKLVVGDVCDLALCTELTKDVDCVVHLAAESHVDNSFGTSLRFTQSNAIGTHTLLEASRINGVKLFIHVSTDEVYGEIFEGVCTESDILNPSNPYSASKAAAEMIVNSYRYSFDMPIITVRGNNVFGIRQFPEKIIPKFCMQAITGGKLTLHGNGKNSRHYLAAEDMAEALLLLIKKGKIGEIYNVGSDEEYTNLKIAEMICALFEIPFEEQVEFIPDRPFNDHRYAVDCNKLNALGWKEQRSLNVDLSNIADWYKDNAARYADIF
jgi:UDP-glucose 4,6-dehydratase